MKKTLLIALLLIPFLGFSQTQATKPIDGFLGIKFGSSKAVVLAAMKAKGAVLDKSDADPTVLTFHNVTLGHRDAVQLDVFFVNNQACQAIYDFVTDVEAKIPGYYADLVSDFTEIYGKGESTKDYTDPYKEGDGNELLGLSAGKITYNTAWTAANQNAIGIAINTQMHVEVTYEDYALVELYLKKQKAADSKDY